jgi:CheY-like chemotaxis protein
MTAKDRPEAAASSRKVVLVVEDEALVRLNACDMLGDMGFEVVDAADGFEALNVLEARRDIDVIFSDCRMPRMTGPELARTVAGRWPSLKIILTTAYQDMETPPWPLIHKPYTARVLEDAVRLAIGGGGGLSTAR